MDNATRVSMESRFGHDFSKVRVHTDEEANSAAVKNRAKAFTVGNDLVFRKGSYAPEAATGKELLAHELSHVIQQGRRGHASPEFSKGLERAAHRAASSIMQGQGPVQVEGASSTGLARQEIVEFGPEETSELIKFWEEKIKAEPLAKKRARYKGYIERLKRGERPSGAQAEEEMRSFYRQIGPAEEKAYKHGQSAPRGGAKSKGSTKPDIPLSSADIEVKARDITNPQNAKSIIREIARQTTARREGGRAYVRQHPVILDLRGQKVTKAQIDGFVADLSTATGIPREHVQVVVNKGQLPELSKPPLSVSPATPSKLPGTSPEKAAKVVPEPLPAGKPAKLPGAVPEKEPAKVREALPKQVEVAPTAKRTQFREGERVEYPGMRPSEPQAELRGYGGGKAATLGEGLAQFLPEAMNAWQDLTIRDGVARRMLAQWPTLERWRREYPNDVILCVVSLQEAGPDGSGMVARGINYVQFFHGAGHDEARERWYKSMLSLPSGGWREVGPFFGWSEPTESLADLKEGVESKKMCFIATACYDSPLAQEVCLLREFRDAVLLRHALGRKFVSAYYRISPPIAGFLRRHDRFRSLIKNVFLALLVSILKRQAPRWRTMRD